MAFDFKKEYKEFYQPKSSPSIVEVPAMNYIVVRGQGDPNAPDSEYKASIPLLYGIAYTIKMSKKGSHSMDGYFDFVVPPLEGFWWQEGIQGFDSTKKDSFQFLSAIRLPDFVTEEEFQWAVQEATEKKKTDFSKVEFLHIEEGTCVQCMHIGPYDTEPQTTAKMHAFLQQEGYVLDFGPERLHHEIYLSDSRKAAPEKCRTVLRHPVRKTAQ